MNKRHYELVIMFNLNYADQIDSAIERYKDLITKSEGIIHRFENWGRMQLAYHIQKQSKAHYFLMNIEVDEAIRNELVRMLGFNDAVIRFLILRESKAYTEPSKMLEQAKPKKSY